MFGNNDTFGAVPEGTCYKQVSAYMNIQEQCDAAPFGGWFASVRMIIIYIIPDRRYVKNYTDHSDYRTVSQWPMSCERDFFYPFFTLFYPFTIYEVKIPLRKWKISLLQRNPAQMTWHIIGSCLFTLCVYVALIRAVWADDGDRPLLF
jgi:hypothetical protein